MIILTGLTMSFVRRQKRHVLNVDQVFLQYLRKKQLVVENVRLGFIIKAIKARSQKESICKQIKVLHLRVEELKRNKKGYAMNAKKNLLGTEEYCTALASVHQKDERRIRKVLSLYVSIVNALSIAKKATLDFVRTSVGRDIDSTTTFRGHAQEKDAVISYTSVLQSQVKCNVQKNVNLNIDVQVEEKVKDRIDEFELVEIISIENRRVETVYGFEVDGTNNYFSGSGLMMHNCVSQNFLCSEMYLPVKPIEKKPEKGYNSSPSIHDALIAIGNDDFHDIGDYDEVY